MRIVRSMPSVRVAEYLGKAARAVAAHHVHLEEPVLRVEKTEREVGIMLAGRNDRRNAVRVAGDAHAFLEPRQRQRSVGDGQGRAQEERDGARRDHEQQHQRQQQTRDQASQTHPRPRPSPSRGEGVRLRSPPPLRGRVGWGVKRTLSPD